MSNNGSRIICGKNPVKEQLKIIKNGELFIQKGLQKKNIQDILKKAEAKKIKISYLEKDKISRKFNLDNHQGIILKINDSYSCILEEKVFLKELENIGTKRCLITVLDEIKDSGNFGAILRNCLLFGVDYVILPKNNSVSMNEIVIKRSAGAALYLKIIYVTNLNRIIEKLKKLGFWFYAADMDGVPVNKIAFDEEKTAIVLGDEGKGIRQLVKKNCDFVISIPNNNKLDSFNVSVSAGIILYQYYINISR